MRYYKKAARLLAVSRAIADAIALEAPQLADRVRVIPNALPFAMPETVATTRARRLLFVGRIHPEKGLGLLLRAAARLPTALAEWKLVLVGPHETRFGGGGETFLRELQRLAERSVLPVEWMGPVFDQAELVRLYQGASLFVYPSTADAGEALPVAPLEAMANGCPPIVSALACFHDYVEDGITGFVFQQQSDQLENDLAKRLTAVLQMEPDALAKVALAAHDRAKQFALERVADRYLSDFESLLQNDA